MRPLKCEAPGDVGASHGGGKFSPYIYSANSPASEVIELINELRQCCPLLPHEKDLLLNNWGVPATSLTDIRIARVVFLSGGRFEFERYCQNNEGCIDALIIRCLNLCCNQVDLCACSLTFDQFGVWQGKIVLLGEENIFAPRIARPLAVHSTPLEWLQANRDGVVIVDLPRARALLQDAGPLAVKSAKFGRTLRTQLTVGPPQIMVIAPPEGEP
jgi:hypothetical protein